jgi:hypothetical protein
MRYKMKMNQADWERGLRVALGLAGIGVALAGISPWGWVGVVPLVTGALGVCPLYVPFKFSTRKGA